MARYSLSDYSVAITYPTALKDVLASASLNVDTNNNNTGIVIGGNNSYVGSISVSRNKAAYEMSGDYTGSYVVSENRDATGSVELSINQISDKVYMLIKIFNIYMSKGITEGFDITVSNTRGSVVATAKDCWIDNIPKQEFGNTPTEQNWSFLAGTVSFSS